MGLSGESKFLYSTADKKQFKSDLITNEGTFYCKHLRTLAPARHRIHFHEWANESKGSAKELGNIIISFSHREFLSQKGQSLAADTKGKQYMEPTYDRLHAEPSQVFSHRELQQQSKLLLDGLAISNSLLLFKGAERWMWRRLRESIGTVLVFSRTHKVMTRRPTCTWAFKCCSSKSPMQKKGALNWVYLHWFFMFSAYLPYNWVCTYTLSCLNGRIACCNLYIRFLILSPINSLILTGNTPLKHTHIAVILYKTT